MAIWPSMPGILWAADRKVDMMARRQSRAAHIAVLIGLPLLLIAGIAYFNARTFTGDYGSVARDDVVANHATAQRELDRLEALLAEKRHHNAGLRADSVNLDLLDERARAELGMLRSDEVFLLEE